MVCNKEICREGYLYHYIATLWIRLRPIYNVHCTSFSSEPPYWMGILHSCGDSDRRTKLRKMQKRKSSPNLRQVQEFYTKIVFAGLHTILTFMKVYFNKYLRSTFLPVYYSVVCLGPGSTDLVMFYFANQACKPQHKELQWRSLLQCHFLQCYFLPFHFHRCHFLQCCFLWCHSLQWCFLQCCFLQC